MFSKTIAALSLCLMTSHAFSADLFKVAPYTLKHTNGNLLLNFQLNEDKKLSIVDGERAGRAFDYKKDQLYKTELAGEACGGAKDLRIIDPTSNAVVFSKTFPQAVCKDSANSDFAFGFISDTQQYTNRHEAIAKIIAHHNSLEPLQFIINGGDVVQNGQVEQEWIEYFKGGSAYISDIPQIAAIGNHDYRGHKGDTVPKYFQKYLRWDGTPQNGNLFFEMPGFQLIIWNSNFSDLSKETEEAMWRWLEAKMVAAQKSKTPLILATHFPVYSSSMNRFTSFSVMKMRKHLVPLAEAYGVKLILSGHTHMYERSFKDGVNYLVAGPAGGRVNKPTMTNKYAQKLDPNVLTFTKIKYSNRTMKVETFDQDNTLIDQIFINY